MMMPSRYRRPPHENAAIEFTSKDYIEKTLNWAINYNPARHIFVITCKRGHDFPVPQGLGANVREILNGYIQEHRGHV